MMAPLLALIAFGAICYWPTAWRLREIRREYMRIEAYDPDYWTQY